MHQRSSDGMCLSDVSKSSSESSSECKLEAPWTHRMSPTWLTEPLVVYKATARQFKLRCCGMRYWQGQILVQRKNEWLNGTMPGLSIAFAGSNSDFKSNDRLPINNLTHESYCKKGCVKNNNLEKSTRTTQRTQSVTNGYFGGLCRQATANRLSGNQKLCR